MTKFNNILETVGDTPVVKINKLAPKGINLYVKSEAFNPLGSVKDRLALGVIEAAEKSGELKPGQTVIEATSGNTGIGLAMVCATKGYPLVVTMAETFSVERRKLMRFLGAKVVLTPAAERGMGMVLKAQELAKTHGWFLTRQFEGPKSSRTSKARSSTIGSQVSAPAARLPASPACCGKSGPIQRSSSVSRPTHPCSRPSRRSGAIRMARRPRPTPPLSRIRCKDGARTSSPRSPPRR
jgi:cysteine synthase